MTAPRRPEPSGCPELTDAVEVADRPVGVHQDQLLAQRLGDDHPIEWIGMRPIERTSQDAVGRRDRQRTEAVSLDQSVARAAKGEPAFPRPDRDLPWRSEAHTSELQS